MALVELPLIIYTVLQCQSRKVLYYITIFSE